VLLSWSPVISSVHGRCLPSAGVSGAFAPTADDMQVYMHSRPLDAVAAASLMCLTVDVLSSWMASNRLPLNPSKTQFSWLGGRRQLEGGIDLPQLAQIFPEITFSLTVCVLE